MTTPRRGITHKIILVLPKLCRNSFPMLSRRSECLIRGGSSKGVGNLSWRPVAHRPHVGYHGDETQTTTASRNLSRSSAPLVPLREPERAYRRLISSFPRAGSHMAARYSTLPTLVRQMDGVCSGVPRTILSIDRIGSTLPLRRSYLFLVQPKTVSRHDGKKQMSGKCQGTAAGR